MSSYTGFAEVYDAFMDNVPYEEWGKYVIKLLKAQGIREGVVCDLACGTGSITEKLDEAGYDMIGVDLSADMLSIANEKKGERTILYLNQDMRKLDLCGRVSAFVCICDGMNYLLEPEDVVQVLKLVNTYLEKDGIFVFDLNTVYKYREVLGEQTIAEKREDMSFIWDNFYDEEKRINEYDLTLFVKDKDGERENSFLRLDEVHYQRGYTIEEMKEMVKEAGLELLDVYDAFTEEMPKEDSERVYFVVKEGYQKGKIYR